MDAVLRATAVYLFLFVLLRFSGRRTLADITIFDFVLLLVISEATQQALLGNDFSVTNAFILITTLITLDVGLSLLKRRWPRLSKLLEGVPMVIVEDGRPLRDRMRRARVDDEDVLEAARQQRGLERMEQIKYAVLEVSGGITIIPKDAGKA